MILPEYRESRDDGKGYGDTVTGGGSGSGSSRIAAVDMRHFGAGYGEWGAGSGAMNQHTNGHGASESDPTHFYDAYIGRPFTQPPWGIAR